MRIGILGSGLMGSRLGHVWARAGHDVVFSYSRKRSKLEDLAKEAGSKAQAGTPGEAARDADAVLLATHWAHVDDVLAQAGSVSGKLLLTCSLPMSEDDSRLVLGHTTSGAEALSGKAHGAHIVSAFSTVPSEALIPVFERRGKGKPPALVFCGNDERAKHRAAQLISDAGFHPLDIGQLPMARYLEPFSLLCGQLAYDDSGSPALVYRFERMSTSKNRRGLKAEG